MLNRVTLIGNLGKDPEVRQLESGASVAKFSLATNESYRDREGEWQTITEWHDIVLWRALAERAERSLKKGMLVYLEGKISKRKWQDREGNDRYTTEVVGNTFKILDRRDNQSTGFGGNFPSVEDELPTANVSQPQEETKTKDEYTLEDDDLPF